jgi:lipid-A-disaccharide synthase
MGFVEVLLNIRTIIKNIAFCKEDILSYKPDALVLIDYPGFNMRIAEFAKKEGIPVYYYISPQVWAWKQNRVFKLQRDVNRLFCILPFEKDFFAKFGMEVDFVGHPLLDVVAEHKNLASNNNFRNKHKLNDKPVIALLPGSRKQEIKVMLPLMLSVVKSFPEYQFVIGAAPSQDSVFYQNLMRDFPEVKLIENDTYGLMANASAGLVTSGTATLEAALWSMPEVVCYKGNVFSYQIAKRLIKVKYISLVNLVMDREVVRELIQDDLNQKMIQNSLQEILPGGSRRTGLMADYQELSTALGGNGASSKTASMLLRNLECHLLSRKV